MTKAAPTIPSDRGPSGSAHNNYVQHQQNPSTGSQVAELSESKFSCYYRNCSRLSDSLDSFLAHCRHHAGWETYMCSDCGFETTKQKLYAQHRNDKHPRIPVRAPERPGHKHPEPSATVGTEPEGRMLLPPFHHRRARSEVFFGSAGLHDSADDSRYLEYSRPPSPSLSFRLTPAHWNGTDMREASTGRQASLPPVAVKEEVIEHEIDLGKPASHVSARTQYMSGKGEISEDEQEDDEEVDELDSEEEVEDALGSKSAVDYVNMRGREPSSFTGCTSTPSSRRSSYTSNTNRVDWEPPRRPIPRITTPYPPRLRSDSPVPKMEEDEPMLVDQSDGGPQEVDVYDTMSLAYPDSSPSPPPLSALLMKKKAQSLPPGALVPITPSKRRSPPKPSPSSSLPGSSNPSASKRQRRSDACPVCHQTFNRPQDLPRHIDTVKDEAHKAHRLAPGTVEVRFACKYCESTFVRKDVTLRHMATVHQRDDRDVERVSITH